jgi:hypothetical protein
MDVLGEQGPSYIYLYQSDLILGLAWATFAPTNYLKHFLFFPGTIKSA